MSDIQERFKHIVRQSGETLNDLSRESGIAYRRWVNVLNGRVRLTADFIEFAARKWKPYSLWLVLGEDFENDEIELDALTSPHEYEKARVAWELEAQLNELQEEFEGKSAEEILHVIHRIKTVRQEAGQAGSDRL
ncbi:hypothetical protein [Arhodomonas sp. AD133]|uniref:hypothetical protein n=1 Tax=Arhodomonas sp. AD133 TaxID=3415009 RepID=UPI003EBEA1FE